MDFGKDLQLKSFLEKRNFPFEKHNDVFVTFGVYSFTLIL